MEEHRRSLPVLEAGAVYGDRYRIVAQIGRGGMGRVYLAEDIRLNGKRRALKLTAAHPAEKDAFIREARILSELQHPHLPDIVDYYPPDADGWAAIVMEYVPGDTLADLFARSGNRLPFVRVLRYLEQLCDLLCYLHGQRPMIVFRDLKPANVLIDRHDRAVLVDFGIARTYRPEAGADTERLGTPAFAAPEQMRGKQTDARSDLYGWGAMAYCLLSGGRFAYRRTGSVRRELQADVPNGFLDLLESVLSEDPEKRPQSAGELKRLLGRLGEVWLPEVKGERAIPGQPSPCTQGVTVAAVLSAYPAAGATFATLGLSGFLSSQGIHHAVVEVPGGEPELFGLLDGRRAMPKHAVFADPSGQGAAIPAWRSGSASYYPADPSGVIRLPEAGFDAWLRQLGVPLVLLDVSSRWERPGMEEWLVRLGLRSMWWIADCLPSKWTLRRQSAEADLSENAARRGTRCGWIANRDRPFAERGEWLGCFPAAPVAKLPWLSAESVLQAVWQGEGYPREALASQAGGRAFQAWAEAMLPDPGK
ncbi:serine/threonine-protein kinase [Cohnella sp. CFH 77786]|uniref:serine/threonine-protein kinase n=1 Tax=Cohnella sp. CFH 77786 TaxID=2662265 RepID=UPI001C60A865|nr:serine/threonine-protein kinase [Cohnella sp. CFH 77786]